MRKRLKIVLTTLLFLTTFIALFSVHLSKEDQNYYELMKTVENETVALQIESAYDLNLISYSKYGYALYSTDQKDQYLDLLDEGFYQNGISYKIGGGPFTTLSDPYIDDQYALDMMHVEEAWNYTTGSTDVMIAIIDSGIDTNHEEFIGKISPLSYNARLDEVGISYVEDDNGHGTMVAGIIGATSGNQKGIAGIMKQSTLLIIKANEVDDLSTTDEDESDTFADVSIINGIYYAVEVGADVINLSLGGTYENPQTKAAIDYAKSQNVVVVAASGNDGINEKLYPASFDYVISVGSVDNLKVVSDFSNHNNAVDFTAPGEDIVTSAIDNHYVGASGTSFAAPQVSGVIGLLIAYDPLQTQVEILNRLIQSVTDQGLPGKDDYYGYGIIDALAAIQYELFTVSFETYGGTVVDNVLVESGDSFTVANPFKEGHTFTGWFLDEAFLIPFTLGVTVVTSDLTLYAKFIPNLYTVHLYDFYEVTTTLDVTYGTLFDDEPEEVTGYQFIGWYLDPELTMPFEGTILGETWLYAKYDVRILTVTFMIDDHVAHTESVIYGDQFNLYTPTSNEATILGWYTDELYENLYMAEPLIEDLVLYGKVDLTQLSVTFYDAQSLEIINYIVAYGDSVTPPLAPLKPSTASIDYLFIDWSNQTNFITSNLSIYPIYEAVYHPESIVLYPGLDTIERGLEWIDAGISLNDPSLTLVLRNNVDSEVVGRYVIYYDIYYLDVLLDTKVRVVNVVEEKIDIQITLEPDLTTIYVDDIFDDAGATSNIGVVETSGTVDVHTPGIYEIIYEVHYADQIVRKIKYVYVLEIETPIVNEMVIFKKEEVTI